MMGEIRKARPLSSTGISRETWFGPNDPFGNSTPDNKSDVPRTVPLFRIEF
jgi:hypothetical protein